MASNFWTSFSKYKQGFIPGMLAHQGVFLDQLRPLYVFGSEVKAHDKLLEFKYLFLSQISLSL